MLAATQVGGGSAAWGWLSQTQLCMGHLHSVMSPGLALSPTHCESLSPPSLSPTERERTERLIKTKLREIMMQKDLENITSKEVSLKLPVSHTEGW